MSILPWKLRADEIGAGRVLTFRAPDEVLEPLAKAIGVDRVVACDANFEVKPAGDEAFEVNGAVKVRVVQTCVITLDPFETEIRELVSVHFAAGEAVRVASHTPPVDDIGDEGSPGMADVPEPIQDGSLDLGGVVQEFLALGVDPYPRKPGERFEPIVGEASPSPFAALSKLRTKDDSDN